MSTMFTLKVALIGNPPAVSPCATEPKCPRPGYAVDAVRAICASLRWNCTFARYNGIDFGDANENGTATGLLGAVQRGEYDTALPMFTPTFSRFRAMRFSKSYFTDDLLLVTRAPSEDDGNFQMSMFYAFQWPVWVLICLSILVFASLFGINNRLRRSSSSIRSAKTLMSLGFLILSGAYTAVLFEQQVSFGQTLPFTDIESFVKCLEKGLCKMISHTPSISSLQVLTAPESDLGPRIRKALERNPVQISPLLAIPKTILTQKNVFLVWLGARSTFLAATKGNAECLFYVVNTPLTEAETFPVRIESKRWLMDGLDGLAAPFTESGLSYAIISKYISQAKCGEKSSGVKIFSRSWLDDGQGLRAMRTVFYCYALGVLGSGIVLIAELGKRYYEGGSRP